MWHFEVVAAVIYSNGKFLCMQRPKSDQAEVSEKYEFPGGKVEKGETMEAALMRELKEELGVSVEVKYTDFLTTVAYRYTDFSIAMHCYLLQLPGFTFEMHEHQNYQWLPLNKLAKLPWAPADKKVVSFMLKNLEVRPAQNSAET